MNNLIRYLFIGALSLTPVALVIVFLNMLTDLGVTAFFRINDITNSNAATGLFFLIGFTLFIFLGYSLEKYGKSFIVSAIDKVFESIPAVRSIYGVMKKLTQMFSGNDETGAKEIVLVEYPKNDLWVAAYVINRMEGFSVLFVPSSPIPTSGYTVIVKNDKLIKTKLTLEEASKFIISMGADFGKKHEIGTLISKHEK